MKRLPRIGPGILVTAAFVGPGTVTTASRAGASAGFALLWAVVLSVIAAIVLQEMAARVGLVTRKSLSEAAMDIQTQNDLTNKILRIAIAIFILMAIGFGNAAYQTGNLSGAASGIESALSTPEKHETAIRNGLILIMMLVSAGILFLGQFRWIQRVLFGLVILMSLLFVVTAIVSRPDMSAMFRGAIVPSMTAAQITTVIGLIGTTAVPYNLFLHSQAVQDRWKSADAESLAESRWDTTLAIALGGVITAAIVMTSASAFHQQQNMNDASVQQLATQLEPTIGPGARWMFALGLMAAGLTSSITAPLAAAYVTCSVFGLKADPKSNVFRAVWIVILVIGAGVAVWLSKQPIAVIRTAQVANGMILPGLAILLWVTVNRTSLLGEFRNRWLSNVAAGIVVVVVSSLTLYKLGNSVRQWFDPPPAIESPADNADTDDSVDDDSGDDDSGDESPRDDQSSGANSSGDDAS